MSHAVDGGIPAVSWAALAWRQQTSLHSAQPMTQRRPSELTPARRRSVHTAAIAAVLRARVMWEGPFARQPLATVPH